MQPFFRIIRDYTWYGSGLPLDVYIDGCKVGSVSNNASQDFQITPGLHEIYVQMEWCRSPSMRYDMKEGTESRAMVALECVFPSGGALLNIFSAVVDSDKFFRLKPVRQITED